MLSKLKIVSFFFALWFGFMGLLASASPVPIVHSPSDDVSPFNVAREPTAVDVVKRDELSLPEVTDPEEVAKREPVASPDPEENVDVEARICRFSCL